MVPLLTMLTVLLHAGAPPARAETPRPTSPFAPSLPQLTDQEEEKLDAIVHRFILSDIGKLKGKKAEKALADFKALGPEAIFALVRGINKAANIESSCPALIIAKKIAGQVRATHDLELLEFLRENIGGGVTASKHMGVLKQLRVECMVRKRAVNDQLAMLRTNAAGSVRYLQARSIEELKQLARAMHGEPLKPILRELEKRDGDRTLDALAEVAAARDKEKQQLGGESLESYLTKQSDEYLKAKLKDERPRVRASAAKVVGEKRLQFVPELIDLLLDDAADPRRAAKLALVKLSGGKDFGPADDDSVGLRDEAARKWRAWWQENDGK